MLAAMKKITLLVTLLITSHSVYAKSLRCIGYDDEDSPIRVALNLESNALYVNSDKPLKITKYYKSGNGLRTESFVNNIGIYVYASVILSNDHATLYQTNATTNKKLSYIHLSC
jgi:hypothetical protein